MMGGMRRNRVMYAVIALLLSVAAANAQVTFSQTGNPPNLRFAAGPDFATDVLGDPWDFSNAEDISPDPDEFTGWQQVEIARTAGTAAAFLANGVFRGVTNTDNPQLALLHRGGYNMVNPAGRNGVRYPIPAARYKKLAVRVTYAGGSLASHAATAAWFFYPNGHPNDASGFGGKSLGIAETGTRTHVVDLAADTPNAGAAWGSQPFVRGLRLSPTTATFADLSIDWVRLTAGDADPHAVKMFANVVCAGSWTIVALDANTIVETPLHSASENASNVAVNYGVLPPGEYQLALRCNDVLLPPFTPFRVNAAPIVRITAPSFIAGEDFATTHLADGAWDMAQPGDVAKAGNLQDAGFVPSPTGRDYRARNIGVTGSRVANDPQVFLLAEPNNSMPIASSRYRYLTYTLTVEGEFRRSEGSAARVVWSPAAFSSVATDTASEEILAWPGRHTYTIDLARLSATPDPLAGVSIETACAPECPTVRTWAERSARFFRIDPHESFLVRYFQLGSVRLTAMAEVALGQTLTVSYRNEDSIFEPGDTHTVRFFADLDRDATNPGTEITEEPIVLQTPLAPAAPDRSFDWSVPVLFTPGTYFIYAQITDNSTGEVRGVHSDVPVRIFEPPTSTVAISIVQPAVGTTALAPFDIVGCALNPGEVGHSGVDDILVTAIGGEDVSNPAQRGVTLALGETPVESPALGSRVVNFPCPAGDRDVPAAGDAFTFSGFGVATVYGLSTGHWTLRVLARDAEDGRITALTTAPFLVRPGTNPATNLRLAGVSGNTAAIAWDAPTDGFPLTGFRIEVATSATFANIAATVVTAPTVTTVSGALPIGVWFVRVVSLGPSGIPGEPSNVIGFTMPGGGPPLAPGPPVVTAANVSANPVTLTWAPGEGGPVSSYTLHAGTSPGASDLIVAPLGMATSVTGNAPLGRRVYARVVAANGVGSAVSNEVDFELAVPTPPGAPSLSAAIVNGRSVTLTWAAGSGGAPVEYGVLARLQPAGPVVAVLRTAAPSLTVAAPPGTYFVSVVAGNAAGVSGESNQILVTVP